MNNPGLVDKRRNTLVDSELPVSVGQLIRLRWLAGIGVILVTILIRPLFHVIAPTVYLLAVGLLILIYNSGFYLIYQRMQRSASQPENYQLLAIAQMVFDWVATTLLVIFSGGIESPAIYFFLFHIVIASIFFEPRTAYLFTAFALLLLNGVTDLEYIGLLPHYNIIGYLEEPLYLDPLYVFGTSVFFGCTAIFITYLVTNISQHLRQRAAEVVALSESLQKVSNRLQVLNESARTVGSTLELAQVLNLLVKNTAEVMNVRACSIRLLDKSGIRLDAAAIYGLSQAYVDKGPILLESSTLDQKVLGGNIVNIPDVSQSSELQYPEWAILEGINSMLSAPLLGKNRVLGTLRAYSEDKDHFTDDDASFLVAIAAQGSIAIENAMAFQAIEALEATKSTFVRTFTHELRSPVGVIHSLLHNITDGYAGEVTPLQRDLLDRAIRRTDYLQELIDDLLDLSAGKIQDKSRMEVEPLVVNAILERVVRRYEIPAHEKGLALEYAISDPAKAAEVAATSDGLDRVFNNLISNAVKYTPPGGQVKVELDVANDTAIVTVQDTGIGIPAESISSLFREFYRAQNAKAVESKGTGLGLAIVKDTVALFNGRVSVQSKLGAGSCFTVFLPIAPAGK